MAVVTLVLHGIFRDLVPDGRVAVHARTVLEACRLLFSQLEAPKAQRYARVLGHATTERLHAPAADGEVHVVPDFVGGGGDGGSFIQIALGTVLVAAGIALTVASGGTASPLAVMLIGSGVSMMLGGVIALMMPAPERPKGSQKGQKDSNYLGTPGNTTEAGTRIPIGYGRCKVFGHYLSFNTQAKDISF